MGACASKPKVKDDAPGARAPAPISLSKDLVPDNDPPVEKSLTVDNVPPPATSPKEISMHGDANGSPKILFNEKVDEQKSKGSDNEKSESVKQEGTLDEKPQMEADLSLESVKPEPIQTHTSPDRSTTKQDAQFPAETEVKLVESEMKHLVSEAKTLSENAEQDMSSLTDNLGEGADQIKVLESIVSSTGPQKPPMQSKIKLPDDKRAVEVVKGQEPRKSEKCQEESTQSETKSPPKPASMQATRESETKITSPPATKESSVKNSPSDDQTPSVSAANKLGTELPPSETMIQSPSAKKNSETKPLVSEAPVDIPSRQSSLAYLDASDKMVVDKAVIEHKLSNGVNSGWKEAETEKAKKEPVADTKIENNGKVTVEKESILNATKTECNKTSEKTENGKKSTEKDVRV